jgi:DNA-directed RNA polymerases I, II, and III subunit RPABC2
VEEEWEVWVAWAAVWEWVECKMVALTQEKVEVGPPKITRFEKARIVGARSLQISMGAPILIEVNETLTSPIDIALAELNAGTLPITIRRTLPDGTFQDIPLKWLMVA